jgi:hypothetical protein
MTAEGLRNGELPSECPACGEQNWFKHYEDLRYGDYEYDIICGTCGLEALEEYGVDTETYREAALEDNPLTEYY